MATAGIPAQAGVVDEVLREAGARLLEPGELTDRLLGRGLEAELTGLFEARDLWAFASYGTIDDLAARVAAGIPVLVGLQSRPDQIQSRQLAMVSAVDQAARTITWRAAGQEATTDDESAFLNRWRPVSFWMLTACRIERATWALGTDERAARALLLARTGQPAAAITDFEAVLASRPWDAGLWLGLGVAQGEAGNAGAAENAFRRAMELKPEDGRAYYHLARQLAAEGRELAEAEQMARRSAQMEAANPEALDALGSVLLRLGRFEEAETALQRARALSVGMPPAQRGQITIRLARAHCGRGEIARARAVVTEAMSENPGLEIPPDLRVLLTPTTAAL